MKENNISRLPWAAFIFIVLIAGLNPIAVRYTVLELPPFWGGAMRFFPASFLMFILAFILRLPIPKGRELWGAILYGGVQFGVGFALLYWGLTKVQPGMASVIISLSPLFTLILAILHRIERFRWIALIGSLISVAGVGLVFREQIVAKVPLESLLAVVLGAVCLSESTVIVKIFPKSHPITMNAVGMGIGSLMLIALAIIGGEKIAFPVMPVTWEALIYSILLGSCVLFILVVYALKRMSASTLSYQLVLMPFVTLSVSNLLTHETLSPVFIAGAALVLIGVYFGGIYSPRRHVQKPSLNITTAMKEQPQINAPGDCMQTGDC